MNCDARACKFNMDTGCVELLLRDEMCIRDSLYTGRVNTEGVNLLLENARFAELTYRIAQYFDDTFASGIAAQNAMLTTLSTPVSYTHLDVYKRQPMPCR